MATVPPSLPPEDPYDPAVSALADDFERAQLTGIGGWLLCFLIFNMLGFLSVLLSFCSLNALNQMEGEILLRLTPYGVATTVISAVLSLFIIYQIFARRLNGARMIRYALLLQLVMAVVNFVLTTMGVEPIDLSALEISPDALMASTTQELLITGLSVLWCLAWYRYFQVSRRVACTFTR